MARLGPPRPARGGGLYGRALAGLICCASMLLPTAGPTRGLLTGPARGVRTRSTACTGFPAGTLRLRGGQHGAGAADAGGSAAVSDCGLLRLQSEQAASDGDPDLSMLEEWRASKLRQLSAVEDAGLRCLLENKKNEEELAWLLQERDTRVPDVPAIDYAAEMGIRFQSVPARAREAAEREGTRLRIMIIIIIIYYYYTHTHTHTHTRMIHTYV
jgi:hypothetical protein